MVDTNKMIPRPLVRTNQWTIVITVLITLVTGVYGFLLLPLLAGILGLATGVNPVMRLARMFLRAPLGSYAMEDRSQQQFNQWIAVGCLTVAVFAFAVHVSVVGYIFSALVGLSAMIAIMGFCVGCFVRFQWNQYRYRRTHQA